MVCFISSFSLDMFCGLAILLSFDNSTESTKISSPSVYCIDIKVWCSNRSGALFLTKKSLTMDPFIQAHLLRSTNTVSHVFLA